MSIAIASPAEASMEDPLAFLSQARISQSVLSDSQSTSATPSRRSSRFRSVKEMLFIDAEEQSPARDATPESSAAMGKPPASSQGSILARKSTNTKTASSHTLAVKDGKINGRATKSSAVPVGEKFLHKTPSSFDVFAIPSSPARTATPPPSQKDASQSEQLLDTPSRESNNAEPYIPAKRTWTPAKHSSQAEVIDLCSPDDAKTTTSFTSILNAYKHENIPSAPTSFDSVNSGPPTKRRCLDFFDLGYRASSSSDVGEDGKKKAPKKRKSVAKKPKTITGLALAPYVVTNNDGAAARLEIETTEASDKEKLENDKPKKQRKKRATSKKSPAKKGVEKPVLLSPQSVKKRMDHQLFVFGTSSQLVKETPPTDGWRLETTGQKINTIQTHAKIHTNAVYDLCDVDDLEATPDLEKLERSITTDHDENAESECLTDTKGWGISELDITKYPTSLGGTSKKRNGGGMWSMSSRGAGGKLQNIEVMDLVDEDDLDEFLSQRLPSQKAPSKIDNSKDESRIEERSLPNVHWTQLPTPATTQPASTKETSVDDEVQVSPVTDATKPNTENDKAAPTRPLRPNFEGYTVAQLQVQIAKYGFKPVKSRNTMIDMLNRCWDSAEANRAAQKSVNDSENVNPKKTTAKAATKGRKKKVETETEAQKVADEEEGVVEAAPAPKKRGRKPKAVVEVVEGAETPKPKRGRKSAVGTDDTPASTRKPKTDLPTIFGHIAAAIKQQPTSPNLQNPSWWQKILMNEIIVLEDFAEWIVETGFGAAGVSEAVWVDCKISEVEGGMDAGKLNAVKKWCDARSVAYTKRKSARG